MNRDDELKKRVEAFIVNELGINLCSVKSITPVRQMDGQLKTLIVDFNPTEEK